MAINRIPKGYRSITPHLVCRNAGQAIEFYQKAFGAESIRTLHMPDGSVMHAEIKIGDSIVMLGEECTQWNVLSPQALGNTPVTIHVFIEDVDSAYQKAVDAGCTATMPLMDQFWGDRYGQVTDPYGHRWSFATHKEDLTEEEIQKRALASMEQMSHASK